jgi:hypothetical protein
MSIFFDISLGVCGGSATSMILSNAALNAYGLSSAFGSGISVQSIWWNKTYQYQTNDPTIPVQNPSQMLIAPKLQTQNPSTHRILLTKIKLTEEFKI